jgi:hypothetical protein
MAYLTQNPNQTFMSPILGQVDMAVTPNTKAVMLDPASINVYAQAGSPVKLVAKAGHGEIFVDVCTGVTDGPIYGVVLYNLRKNKYAAGDMMEVGCRGTVVYLESSTTINRGARVNSTAATASADPLVTTVANNTDWQLGVTLDQASAANDLVRVEIDPSDPNLAY